MSTETSDEKALRLIGEGKLTVLEVARGRVIGRVQGDHGTYMCGFDPQAEEWRCTCAEMKGMCSHLKALWLVTTG